MSGDYAALLREHGMRATPQRVAILEALAEGADHATVPEVHERLAGEQPTVSLSTVYEALARLAEEGLVAALPSWDGTTRYEARTDPHVNVVCEACGAIADVDAGWISDALARADRAAACSVPEQPVAVRGRCPACAPSR